MHLSAYIAVLKHLLIAPPFRGTMQFTSHTQTLKPNLHKPSMIRHYSACTG